MRIWLFVVAIFGMGAKIRSWKKELHCHYEWEQVFLFLRGRDGIVPTVCANYTKRRVLAYERRRVLQSEKR